MNIGVCGVMLKMLLGNYSLHRTDTESGRKADRELRGRLRGLPSGIQWNEGFAVNGHTIETVYVDIDTPSRPLQIECTVPTVVTNY